MRIQGDKENMKKITIDNTSYYENFRIYDKFMKHPEKLTRREKKRLKELGIEV